MNDVHEARRQAQLLHGQLKKWWTDAARLESQGKTIPARTLRERMQQTSWGLKRIVDLLDEGSSE